MHKSNEVDSYQLDFFMNGIVLSMSLYSLRSFISHSWEFRFAHDFKQSPKHRRQKREISHRAKEKRRERDY